MRTFTLRTCTVLVSTVLLSITSIVAITACSPLFGTSLTYLAITTIFLGTVSYVLETRWTPMMLIWATVWLLTAFHSRWETSWNPSVIFVDITVYELGLGLYRYCTRFVIRRPQKLILILLAVNPAIIAVSISLFGNSNLVPAFLIPAISLMLFIDTFDISSKPFHSI